MSAAPNFQEKIFQNNFVSGILFNLSRSIENKKINEFNHKSKMKVSLVHAKGQNFGFSTRKYDQTMHKNIFILCVKKISMRSHHILPCHTPYLHQNE